MVFRYFSTEAFRLYTEGLRFEADSDKVVFKLRWRDCVLVVGINLISKAASVAGLGVGVFRPLLSFVHLLGL